MTTATAFDLPAAIAAKADPALIAVDERRFAGIAAGLAREIAAVETRLAAERRAPGGTGQAALDRDLEIHRLSARLRALRRFGLDACLGRIVPDDGGDPLYIGRFGLSDDDGRRLLIDWRTPAAAPYFGATHGDPMGLASRRRYRWAHGHVVDYWDEVFAAEGLVSGRVALDDQSAFIASLGASRSPRMRDVLATIQADQDAIIRARAAGALVVDGGPGTGKTVVALHRAAYLIYADPQLGHGHGGVLFVGPNRAYLDFVGDVLPSLGEEGVQTCTLRDLVAEGAHAVAEADPEVAALKASAAMVDAIEPAVALYEEPPTTGTLVETPWADIPLERDDWAEAFASPEPGLPHNLARDQVWDTLLDILGDKVDERRVAPHRLRQALTRNDGLRRAFQRAWPLVEASVLVADLWSVPAYLRRCAPWLTPEQVRALQRDDPRAWTVADLPLLDAARRRLGDPQASRRRREREAALAAEREERGRVADELIAADDSEMMLMSILRGEDAVHSLDEAADAPAAEPDALAGPFAHIVVDEAQELTDAEWRMLLGRAPSRSLTVVGDRAQARHGFAQTWQERLARVGLRDVRLASLTINYRTPREVMAEAEPVIRAAVPDANVPVSVRSNGLPVVHGSRADLDAVLDRWLDTHAEGVACVIGDASVPERPRVRSLEAAEAKGLEFDLVVLVDPPAAAGEGLAAHGIEAAVDRYVAMTRATQQLVVLASSGPRTGGGLGLAADSRPARI